MSLLDYLGEGGDLQFLYLGKIGMEHIKFIEKLRWRKVLKPSALRPPYLDTPDAEEKQKRLNKGLSVLDLVHDAQ